MDKILDVMEDIKQNITDNQYKIIMESLMEMNKINNNGIPLLTNNQERYKFVCLFNWLDKKLEITEYNRHSIKRSELQKYVITNYFDCRYYENIDFVKQILKIYFSFSTKGQNNSYEYQFVKYRD
jgi:hypothetical protein